MTFQRLTEFAENQRAMAKAFRDKGAVAAADACDEVAEIAEELLEYREIYGALSERGFLTR